MRASEYGRFDAQRHTYLDYTGGGVYAESRLLERGVFGNPHFGGPASLGMTAAVEHASQRCRVLRRRARRLRGHLFTLNATGAGAWWHEAHPIRDRWTAAAGQRQPQFREQDSEFARRAGIDVDYASQSRHPTCVWTSSG
jgi:hypothetical protein